MGIRDTLKKATGLFVQFDSTPTGTSMSNDDFKRMMEAQGGGTPAAGGAPAPRTVEQIVRDSPGPNLDEIKVSATPQPQVQPLGADGSVDFKAIYGLANVQDAPFTAEQLLDLLATLPAKLPLEARRQTVKITIQAMAKTVAVTPEIIVADASRKLAALAAYEESYGKQADEFVTKSEADIQALTAQIEAKKKAIEDAKAKHDSMNKSCTTESHRLDDVLEFFSMDIPPSKYA